jgi:hypothetical protein
MKERLGAFPLKNRGLEIRVDERKRSFSQRSERHCTLWGYRNNMERIEFDDHRRFKGVTMSYDGSQSKSVKVPDLRLLSSLISSIF